MADTVTEMLIRIESKLDAVLAQTQNNRGGAKSSAVRARVRNQHGVVRTIILDIMKDGVTRHVSEIFRLLNVRLEFPLKSEASVCAVLRELTTESAVTNVRRGLYTITSK